MMIGLLFASQAAATYQDTLKKFETKENALCKSQRLYSEGGYSSLKKPISYQSYRINDIQFRLATVIVIDALYNDNIRNATALTESSDGIYSMFARSGDNIYYGNFDRLDKYTTDVCIVVRPSAS